MENRIPKELQLLIDKDAIKEVLYDFDYMSDDGDPLDAIDRYCTDDIIFEGGPMGSTQGKDAFKESARHVFTEQFVFTRHMLHNPLIKVDGDEASGKWYADIPTVTGEGEAVLCQITYTIAFRRVGGRWLISYYKPEFAFATPFEKGWVKQPFIEGIDAEVAWET